MNNISQPPCSPAFNQLHPNVYCRCCQELVRDIFVDLGMCPLVQSFIRSDGLDDMERFYPLRVLICSHCKLAQLRDYVDPDGIFTEYAYFSSYSTSWVEHAQRYCDMITRRLRLTSDSLVVEIAANDGYLLQHFLPFGVPVLGIEPAANVAEVAVGKGIPTIVEFFGEKLGRSLAHEGRAADLIVANNVFAHVPQLSDFISGLSPLLKPEGVVTLEFPHLERLLVENQFDTIYHEHYSYFSLMTTERAVAPHGLRVFDVEELSTHGGSLRVYLCHANSTTHLRTPHVDAVIMRERKAGLDELATYAKFGEEVRRVKRDLLQLLISLKSDGKSIVGYGAAGKGSTLLNYCGIGPDFLDFVVDRNPYKHGLFTPGTHVPIYPVELVDEAKPDYILILPWNLKNEIVAQMCHIGAWGGQFIIPIPQCKIITPTTIRQ